MNEWSLVALGDKMFLGFLPSVLFNNNILLVNGVRISAKLRFSPEEKGLIKISRFYLRFMDRTVFVHALLFSEFRINC